MKMTERVYRVSVDSPLNVCSGAARGTATRATCAPRTATPTTRTIATTTSASAVSEFTTGLDDSLLNRPISCPCVYARQTANGPRCTSSPSGCPAKVHRRADLLNVGWALPAFLGNGLDLWMGGLVGGAHPTRYGRFRAGAQSSGARNRAVVVGRRRLNDDYEGWWRRR